MESIRTSGIRSSMMDVEFPAGSYVEEGYAELFPEGFTPVFPEGWCFPELIKFI